MARIDEIIYDFESLIANEDDRCVKWVQLNKMLQSLHKTARKEDNMLIITSEAEDGMYYGQQPKIKVEKIIK